MIQPTPPAGVRGTVSEMDDDVQIGYLLTRREVLSIAGGAAAVAFLAACTSSTASPSAAALATTSATSAPATTGASSTTTAPAASAGAASSGDTPAIPSCIVRPALTEGPYFVEELLNRSDIRSDPSTGTVSDGAKLQIRFLVSQLKGSACTAFEGAVIDVWHCDATGVYSDVSGSSGQKFLRGYQTTDASGVADFTTIYPGWYQGRAVHIHFKIRTSPGATSGLEFTSQLFFDDNLSDTVFGAQPYSTKGQRDRLNAQDDIYTQSQGQTLLAVTSTSDGYTGSFAIGLQVS